MTHYAGLDVSVRTTSVCIVDAAGKVVRETRIPTEPAAIIAILSEAGVLFHRIGLEAGPLSQWLFGALIEAGLPAICVETRHMKAALAAQVNKTDRNDARGIAQMMRVGLYRPVHVKTHSSQEKRTLLASRKLLQDQIRVLENHIRGSLRTFGLKVGLTSAGGFEGRVREFRWTCTDQPTYHSSPLFRMSSVRLRTPSFLKIAWRYNFTVPSEI